MPAEIQFEGGKRVEQRAVGAAYRSPAGVIVGHHAQRPQSVADRYVVALVRGEQCLRDRPPVPLEGSACWEQQLLLAAQVGLELSLELVEAHPQGAQLGVVVAVSTGDGGE